MIARKDGLTSDPETQKQLKEAQNRYLKGYQKANYTHFSNTQLSQIFRLGTYDKNGDPVFFVFGMYQPYQQQKMQRLYLLMIKWFQQQFRNMIKVDPNSQLRFSILYFNNQCNTYMQYIAFRGIYRSLPLKYLLNLKRLIVVNPGIAVKTLEWIVLGTINKHLRSLTHYIDTIQQLGQFGILLTEEVLNVIPENIMAQYLANKGKRVNPLCNNICESVTYDTNINGSNRIKQKIFFKRDCYPESEKNIKIQYQVETKPKPINLMKKRLQDYELSDIEVPLILKLLITYLQMRPNALTQEGIFRRSVSIDDENQAITQIYQKNYDFLEKIDNPHIVANLIKKFLVNLVEPVISYSAYSKFIYNLTEENMDIKFVKNIIKQLPKINYITLQFVLSFFKDQVIPKDAQNKMNCYNVSVVLYPCLLRSQSVSMNDLVYGKKLVKVIQNILLNFDFIFGPKNQQLKVYRQSSKTMQTQFQKSLISENPTIDKVNYQQKQKQKAGNIIIQQKPVKNPVLLPIVRIVPRQSLKAQISPEQLVLSNQQSQKARNSHPRDSLSFSESNYGQQSEVISKFKN